MDSREVVLDSGELVRRTQVGDRRAAEEILERYYPRVLALVRARLGRGLRRYVESDDIVQETMIEVVRGIGGVEMRDERALVRWVARVVENRIRDAAKYYGAQRRRPAGIHSLEKQEVGSRVAVPVLVDSKRTPAQAAEEVELFGVIQCALERMDARQRDVIELHAARMPWKDIARRLGYPTSGAARQAYARARVMLVADLTRLTRPTRAADALP